MTYFEEFILGGDHWRQNRAGEHQDQPKVGKGIFLLRVGLGIRVSHEINDVSSREEENKLHDCEVRRKMICEDIHVTSHKNERINL